MAKLLATTYDGLDAALGHRMERKIGHNTVARHRGDLIVVRLHYTDIVQLRPNGAMNLNPGGFHTVTTKERINQFLPPTVGLTQKDWDWFLVSRKPGWEYRVPFRDFIEVDADGRIVGVNA